MLVRSPAVLPLEPITCWIGRLALSQGATLTDLSEFFGFDCRGDLDLRLTKAEVRTLIRVCRLPEDAFFLQQSIFSALRSLRRTGKPFLAFAGTKPRFRFCPLCLASFRTPYFPLHWRFIAWRYCPQHGCLLEDHCPHCEEPVTLPVSQLVAGPNHDGVATLTSCMRCGQELTEVAAVSVSHVSSDWERIVLANGRAVLAALLHRRVQILGNGQEFSVRKLLELRRRGFIPSRIEWLAPARLRERLHQ